MKYYFPDEFDFEREFFNKTEIKSTTKTNVLTTITEWIIKHYANDISVFKTVEDEFVYILEHTLQKINVEYDYGVFYYHWLNEFLREVSYLVWRAEEKTQKKSGENEKKAAKAADVRMKEFNQFCKENFK